MGIKKAKIELQKIVLIFTSLITINAYAGSVIGTVKDEKNIPVPFASVMLMGTTYGTAADGSGKFILSNVEKGNYTINCRSVGYQTTESSISVDDNAPIIVNLQLNSSPELLSQVAITGKHKSTQLKETPYTVEAIELKDLYNSNKDINMVLGEMTGVSIRETGGLGSSFDFSLNGLSGNQVRFFVDGIPVLLDGSAFSFNNIPVNLIERVEVYKGVVPVHLGSDALGGAVNIITKRKGKSFTDASYSMGSFNTHRFSLNNHTVLNDNLVLNAKAFYNYSDNNYKIDVKPVNSDGTYAEEVSVKRFHDKYKSRSLSVETGYQNKSWADLALVGVSLTDTYNALQHGASMDRPLGQVYYEEDAFSPYFIFEKKNLINNKLDLSAHASYTRATALAADSSSRKYDWYGNYTLGANNTAELTWQKSLFEFTHQTFQSQITANYVVDNLSNIDFSVSYSNAVREGKDPLARYGTPFENPNYLNKLIIGLAYNRSFAKDKLKSVVFAKYYQYNSKANEVSWSGNDTTYLTDFNRWGSGIGLTWFPVKGLQLKSSFEYTYRLPDGDEMFGDGLSILHNPNLKPEESINLNLGSSYNLSWNKHDISVSANTFYRDAQNFIRLYNSGGATSYYENLRSILSSGVEGELIYSWNNQYRASANITWQNIINNSQYEGSRVSNVYKDRIPNKPYLLGNIMIGAQYVNLLQPNSKLSWHVSGHFVEEFYLKWPSQGGKADKYTIPQQVSLSAEVRYALKNGRYNIAMACSNLTNAKLYDYFRVQKPGRAISVKLRYFLQKQKNIN